MVVLAALVLAGCSSNSSSSGTTNGNGDSSKASSSQVATGTVTNTPTTLADFTATVKASGYTIISGQTPGGGQVSGSTTLDNGHFFANVEVDGYKGTVSWGNSTFLIVFDDLRINDGGSELPQAHGLGHRSNKSLYPYKIADS